MKKILITDDDNSTLEFMSLYFEEEGYEVIAANSGRQAVTEAEKNKPDIILLDLQMPDMNGLEALEEIKKRLPSVKIIMLTGVADGKTIEKVLRLGASNYVLKPVNLDHLKKQVRELITHSANST